MFVIALAIVAAVALIWWLAPSPPDGEADHWAQLKSNAARRLDSALRDPKDRQYADTLLGDAHERFRAEMGETPAGWKIGDTLYQKMG